MIDQQLRQAIRKSGMTHYRLAQLSGTTPAMIDKFMGGKGTSLATAAKLAAALGLTLAPAAQASPPQARRRGGKA